MTLDSGVTIIGIDPGIDGGVVGVDLQSKRIIGAHPMPTLEEKYGKSTRRVIDGVELTETIMGFVPDFVMVEKVQAMSKQGVTSMFRFGEGFGMIRGVLSGLKLRNDLVSPIVWKKHHGLIGTQKDAAIDLVHELAPEKAELFTPKRLVRTKSQVSGMADAALIAFFAVDVFESVDNSKNSR